jgi:excisionase family DNA binding protein
MGGEAMDEAQSNLMTITEVAEYFRISEQTVYRWLSRGILTAIRVGNVTRIRREDLQAFIDAHTRVAEDAS